MDGIKYTNKYADGMQITVVYEKNNMTSSPAAKSSPALNKSTGLTETPVRKRMLSKICENEVCSPSTSMSSSNLPILATPPSRPESFVRNPFEQTRRKKLHLPFSSPTLFTKSSSPSKSREIFYWSIDDLANLLPADIDESQAQNDQSCDDQTEQEVQNSIRRFFESNSIVPSPWGAVETIKPLILPDLSDTPVKPTGTTLETIPTVLDFEDKEEIIFPIIRKEAWTQTELTVPFEVLSPFESLRKQFQVAEDENETQEEDSTGIERYASELLDDRMCSSPCYTLYRSLLSSTIHTPKNKIIRSFGTPLGQGSSISPIGLSPIVQSFQQVSSNIEVHRESMECVQCTCHDMSCDSGISSAMSQTEMSFPSTLPKDVEDVLKPFQTFIQDLSETEEMNLNSSLSRRRKLLFHEDLDMSTSSINSVDNSNNSF